MVENSQIESSIAEIRKRNGKVTNFDKNKITNAIHKALMATNQEDRDLAEELTNGVLDKLVTQGFRHHILQVLKISKIWLNQH